MRQILAGSAFMLIVAVGCSGRLDGRAATSSGPPMAVDLSPSAMKGETPAAAEELPADSGTGHEAGDK